MLTDFENISIMQSLAEHGITTISRYQLRELKTILKILSPNESIVFLPIFCSLIHNQNNNYKTNNHHDYSYIFEETKSC